MMKRLLTLSILSILSVGISAQTATVKKIRTLYAEAVKEMDLVKKKKNPEPGQYAKFEKETLSPNCVVEKSTIEFYAPMEYNEATHKGEYHVLMIRERRKELTGYCLEYYTEYLFDRNTGELLFSFQKNDGVFTEIEVTNECRYYFNAEGKCDTFSFKMKERDTGEEFDPMLDIEPDYDNIKADAERLKKNFFLF